MNLLENIKESLRSIRGNRLRTVLTSMIIAIGISALVGILTAIDGIQNSVNQSFAGLGYNSFDIRNRDVMKRRKQGEKEKTYPAINYHQSKKYKEVFGKQATVGMKTNVTFSGEVKYASKKTNPNSRIIGTDENYMKMKSYKIAQGRDFSGNDFSLATNVCILGVDLVSTLFDERINPVGQEISIYGGKYKVIGLLEKKGSMMGGGDDRVIFVPLETARKMKEGSSLSFDIVTSSDNIKDIETIMGEARGVMRAIRQDKLGFSDSFTIDRSDAVAKQSEGITDILRMGGFGIGFITLLGAAIALMNIMLVSVTERTREIGIRKSLGATPQLIRLQFLIEAVVICILGGLGGLLFAIPLGNLIANGIMGASNFVIPWFWMFLGITVCVIVGLFSGIYPAYKASKLDPIDALRYE